MDFLSGWSVHWHKWGIKVPYYYSVTVNFSLCRLFFALCIRCSFIGCMYIYNCYIFFLDWMLDHYEMSLFVSCYILKSIFYISISTLAFFSFPFTGNTFFHPPTFSLCVSLDLKWVSFRQHIYASCFCIHSATPCLFLKKFLLEYSCFTMLC